MKASDIPSKFQIPFADSAGGGFKRSIPVSSQIGIQDGAASLTDGFPPLNFLATGAGGVPPYGQDFNGLLNQSTAWDRWLSAGAPVTYDAAFQSAIGGYPSGTLLQSAATQGLFWYCLVDDNTTNPDLGGAGWIDFSKLMSRQQSFNLAVAVFNASTTWVVPANAFHLEIEVWGGGGGAGAGNGTVGGLGGGGGGYGMGYFSATPGETLTITVGTGGLGANVPGNGGANGGSSAVLRGATTLISVVGGFGAAGDPTGNAAAGGNSSTGTAEFIPGFGGFIQAPWTTVGSPGGGAARGSGYSQQGNGGTVPGGGGCGNSFNNPYSAAQISGAHGRVKITYVA